MRNKKRAISTVLLAGMLCLSLTLSGCGSKGDDAETNNAKPTIMFTHPWPAGSDAVGEFFEPALENFIKENEEDFNVEVMSGPGDDLRTKIKAEIAQGNVPDVFIWHGKGMMKELIDADILQNVDEVIEDSDQIDWEDITDSAWKAGTLDGENYYAFPMSGVTTTLVANKSLFEKFDLEYPTTYEELLEVSEVFNANGIVPFACGSKNGNPAHLTFSEVLAQYTPEGYSEGFTTGESEFDCEAVEKAVEYMQDMAKNKVFPEDTITNGDFGQALSLYNNQQAAMITLHPWNAAAVDKSLWDVTEPIDFWQFPGAVRNPKDFFVGGMNYVFCISKQAYQDESKRDAVLKLAEFLLSDIMTECDLKAGVIPPQTDIPFELNEYLPEITQKCNAFNEQKEEEYFTYILLPSAAIQQYYCEWMDNVCSLAVTPEQALKDMQGKIDETLQ